MGEQVWTAPAGKVRRTLNELANGGGRAAIDILLCLSVAYFLAVIATRAMPYRLVKVWHFPFFRIENAMYAAALLFVVRRFMRPSNDPGRFFVAPIDLRTYSNLRCLRKDTALCAGVFLLSVLYLMVIYDKAMPNPDEGWILTLSDRVLNGEIPHKDFFLLTTPAAIYLNAWAFRVFGASIAVERALTLVVAAGASSLFYMVARMGMGFFFSAGASLLFLVWQFPFFFQASYSWYAAFFSMAAFWAAGLAIMSGRRSGAAFLLIGLLCGISFAFKQNTGMVALAAIMMYFPAERILFCPAAKRGFLGPFFAAAPSAEEVAPLFRKSALLVLGFVLPVGASALFYFFAGHLTGYLEAIFVTPFVKSREFVTPYVVLSRLTDKRVMAYMPHFTVLFTLGNFFIKFRKAGFQANDRFPLLLALATFFNFLTVFPRADIIHIVFALWPSIALLAYWAQQSVVCVSRRWSAKDSADSASSIDLKLKNLLLASLASLVFVVFLISRADSNISFHENYEEIAAPRGRRIFGKKGDIKELNETTRFIDDYSRQNQLAAMFSTNPLLYFLTGVPNITSHDYVLSGNGPDGYVADILEALEREKPRLVIFDVLFLRWYPIPEDWWRIQSHIFRNYKLIFESSGDRYMVLEPKEGNQ